MNKFIKLLLLNLVVGSSSVLLADENIFTNAKVAIQMIEKSDVQFLVAEESRKHIRGSKTAHAKLLSSATVLGSMPCSPLYSCPSQVEAYFSRLGITRNQSLILYDNSYGVYASTLYAVLESVGHENMTILDGGVQAIEALDPNQKLFVKYQNELNLFKKSLKENNSTTDQSESNATIKSLLKKMEMVKPHLLIEKNLNVPIKEKSDYGVKKKNSTHFLSTKGLERAVQKFRSGEQNLTIVDVCPMVDIVGNRYGNYLVGVTPLSWQSLVEKKENKLKSKALLEKILEKASLSKEANNYLYCMSESSKALFVMMVMRELGYTKVKAYTGNWSTWRGEGYE